MSSSSAAVTSIPAASPSPLTAYARSPYGAWAASFLLLASTVPTARIATGFPHLVQLPLFASIFGGSGYIIQAGDALNGAGTTTAWSLTFLFLNAKRALLSRRPGPIFLSSAIGLNALIYGVDYFGFGAERDDE